MRLSRFAVLTGISGIGALAACGGADAAPDANATCNAARVFVATGDASSAGLAIVEDGKHNVVPRFGTDLGRDPQFACGGGRAFFIARDVGNLIEVDACGTPIAKWFAGTDRAGSENPQDVAVASDGSLWVPFFGAASIEVLSTSGGAPRFVDISTFDDDGNPQANAIVRVLSPSGPKMYVAMERLDDGAKLSSTRTSLLVKFDETTALPEKTFTLLARNPFNRIVHQGDALYLTSPGDFQNASETTAGIERFDLVTETSRLFAREADLGGSVTEAAFTNECGAAIVAGTGAKNPTALVSFATSGGVLGGVFPSTLVTDDYDLVGLAVSRGVLWVGDQRRESGGFRLRAFEFSAACELVSAPDRDVLLTQQPVSMCAP